LGTDWEKPEFELQKPISLKKCQAFLLCSDGFWELIEEETMSALLSCSSSVDEWLAKMIEEVKRNGQTKNMDNFSAIAVWKV
jgi:serine/threonine protein phosphatase PrpC